MARADAAESPYSLSPIGAGDLIDRAVRFYRKFFWTLVLIAAPPVIAGTLISVGWTVAGRGLFSLGRDSQDVGFYYIFIWFGSVVIWFTETVATLVVMGGASRNFVRHILFGEPMKFSETYRNTWSRLGGLIVAASTITLLLGGVGFAIFYFGMIVVFLVVLVVALALSSFPLAAIIVSVIAGIAIAVGVVWVFFLVASRLAYVPQVMLVEGQGVFSAIGRSATLAGGSVWRLAALFIFSLVAAYSALALLYVPLAWYASASGVQIMTFNPDMIPAWYEIAYNLIWQVSFILLSPVWMVGLCLLYVDERVRSEGYDIELMAARRLGDIPSVPSSYINPLQPALSQPVQAVPPPMPRRGRSDLTTLGLK
jgi:hypothetical protein